MNKFYIERHHWQSEMKAKEQKISVQGINTSDKGLTQRIYKEHLQISKKMTNSIEKWEEI